MSLQKEEERLNKFKRYELFLFKYNKSLGLALLYVLPFIIIFVVVGVYVLNALAISFLLIVGLWILYVINTLAIFLGTNLTRRVFLLEQKVNRMKGLPFDSLQGFETIKDALDTSMLKIGIVSMVVILSLSAYFLAFIAEILPLAYAATGLVLISLGLAIWMKPANYTTSQIMGLLGLYEPTTHPTYVDYIFTEFLQTFMDPPTLSKFDEYTEELTKGIKEGYNVEQAREKILFCMYLYLNEVLTEEDLKREILEVVKEDQYANLIEKHEFFNIDVLLQVIKRIRKKIPPFCTIIDRVQFNLLDNLSLFKSKEIYFDVCVEPEVRGKEAELIILLYNNTLASKEVLVRVIAPEFVPVESEYRMKLVGRKDFEIEVEKLSLSSATEQDVIECESKVLDLGDVLWITLTSKDFGERRINIFLEDDKGNIIQGINLRTRLKKDIFKGIRKLSGGGSIGTGIAVPLVKLMGSVPSILDKLGM